MGYLGVALVAIDGMQSIERLHVLLNRLVNFIAVMSFVGIVQYFTPLDPSAWIRVPGLTLNSPLSGVSSRSDLARIIGTMLHPIEFAAVLCIATPLAYHYLIHPLRQTRWNAIRLGIIGLAIPLSISRTAFLILFVTLPYVVDDLELASPYQPVGCGRGLLGARSGSGAGRARNHSFTVPKRWRRPER